MMQLGMVGLGRMGANMVRRLIGGGHQCVVFDVSPKAVAELAKENAVGASSLADLAGKLSKPRGVAHGSGGRRGQDDRRSPPPPRGGRQPDRRRQLLLRGRHPARQGAGHDEGTPAEVLTAALYERFASRGEAEFQNKVMSAMRYAFGGPLEKAAR